MMILNLSLHPSVCVPAVCWLVTRRAD